MAALAKALHRTLPMTKPAVPVAKLRLNNGSKNPTRQSHLPMMGSPLLAAGSNPAGLLFDQRGPGFPRQIPPFNPDIGAVEFLTARVMSDCNSGACVQLWAPPAESIAAQ